jgi:hypothetical protein
VKINLKTQGISEAVQMLGAMTKEGKSARLSAIRDTGKMVEKELKKERASGSGWQPLGAISRALGNRRAWGKSKFVTYALKRTIAAIITTKGMNKKMEEGGNVTVSPAFRKFLHTKGIHLKASTVTGRIPARPLFARVWSRVNSQIVTYFEERFHYQLSRALRRWRVG